VALGAHETGFMIGYIPAEVSYTAIHEGPAPRRQSVALFWLATNASAGCTVHPPAWHRSIVADIYAHNGLERVLADDSAAPELEGRTSWSVEEHDGHNGATVIVEHLGADVLQALRGFLATEARRGRDVLYLELPLRDPRTAALPPEVHDELGFFFGGIVPELRDGDVLRLQWLNDVEADPSDVAVASDFGRELLAYIFERKAQHSR
jgi:serine/threonine-protein kinase RsbW